MKYNKLIYLLPLTLLSNVTIAQIWSSANWESSGELSVESRRFNDDHDRTTVDSGVALYSKLNVEYNEDSLKYRASGFGRFDRIDSGRNIMAFKDNYIAYTSPNFYFVMGIKEHNWTVLEAFHPADILNSRNYDSDLGKQEKLGEMTVSLERTFETGSLSFLFLPHYKDPHFPSESSRMSLRLSPSPYISNQLGDPIYVEDNNTVSGDNWGAQWGARLVKNFDQMDLSFNFVQHMDRSQPLFSISDDLLIHPYYFRVSQFGSTLQWVLSKWIIKSEIVHRKFKSSTINTTTTGTTLKPTDHTIVALGLERSVSLANSHELLLFIEGQSLFGTTKLQRSLISPFQRDAMLGFNYMFNDVDNMQITTAWIVDLERKKENYFSFSYSQRLGEVWNVKTGLYYIDAPAKQSTPVGLEVYDNTNYVFLNLTRHF